MPALLGFHDYQRSSVRVRDVTKLSLSRKRLSWTDLGISLAVWLSVFLALYVAASLDERRIDCNS